MPDGSSRPVRDFKLRWEHFDFLIQTTTYSETVLAQLATHSAMETGRTFEQCFPSIVAYIYKLVRENP